MPWSHHNKPPPFTPVNYDHPFARHLVFFCPLHWCQGYAFDVMQRIDGGGILTGYGANGGNMYSAGQRGWYWEAPTDPATSELGFAFGSTEASPDSAYSPTHPTICARFRPAFTCSTINGGARVLSKGQVVNNTDDYAIYRDSSLFGRIATRMRGVNGEGLSLFFDRAAGTWEGVLLDVAAVNDYGVAGSHRGYLWAPEVGEYVEPTPVQGGDNTNGDVATTGEALAIGHRPADERTWQGWIEYAAVFRRPMSREEIRTFMDNPWVIFQDPQSDVSFLSSTLVEAQRQFPQKRTWTTQPPPGTPLDMSHPAMKHCIFVRNGEYKRDLLTGQRPTNSAATGDSLADRRIKGNSRGLNYASAATYVDVYASGGAASDKFDGLSECSIMAVLNADSFTLGNDENRVFVRDNTSGTHAGCDFYLDLKEDGGATGALDACAGFIGEEPNVGGARITTHDVATDKQYSLGGRFKSGQTQWVHLWSEGVGHLNDESTNSPAGSLSTAKDLWLGGRADDAAADDFDGVIPFAAAFDSFLPQALFESLLENPYQIFKPRTEYSPYIVESVVVTNVPVITDVANSGETPGAGTETWDDGSTGNVITGTNFL